MNRASKSILGVSLSLGFLLRFYAGIQGLYWDEETTINLIRRHGVVELVHEVPANQPHFPAYYMLIDGWTFLTGYPVITGRLLSVFAGTATIYVAYRLAQLVSTERVALAVTLVLALSPTLIVQSGWLRPYAIFTLLVSLSLYELVRIVRGAGKSNRWALTLFGCALLHPYGLFVVAAHALVLLYWRTQPRVCDLFPPVAASSYGSVILLQKLTVRGGRPSKLKHIPDPPTLVDMVAAIPAVLVGRLFTIGQAVAVVAALGGLLTVRYHDRSIRTLGLYTLAFMLIPAILSYTLSEIWQLKYVASIAVPLTIILFDGVHSRHRIVLPVTLTSLLAVQLGVIMTYPGWHWLALRGIA